MWNQLCDASPFVCFAEGTLDDPMSIMRLLINNPWLIIVCLALLIPITGIVFGTITDYLRKIKVAEIEAALKRDMLERGMTPEQIKIVVEASSSHRSKRNHANCV